MRGCGAAAAAGRSARLGRGRGGARTRVRVGVGARNKLFLSKKERKSRDWKVTVIVTRTQRRPTLEGRIGEREKKAATDKDSLGACLRYAQLPHTPT